MCERPEVEESMEPSPKEPQFSCFSASDSIVSVQRMHNCNSFSSGSDLAKIDKNEEIFVVGEYHLSSCPICLERFTLDNPAVLVACGHGFHLQCVEDWKQRSPMCPVCMKPVNGEGVPMMSARETRRRRRYKSGGDDCFCSAAFAGDGGDVNSADDDVHRGVCPEPGVVDPMLARHQCSSDSAEQHVVSSAEGRGMSCFVCGAVRAVLRWCFYAEE